jgi:hypothetical protein
VAVVAPPVAVVVAAVEEVFGEAALEPHAETKSAQGCDEKRGGGSEADPAQLSHGDSPAEHGGHGRTAT